MAFPITALHDLCDASHVWEYISHVWIHRCHVSWADRDSYHLYGSHVSTPFCHVRPAGSGYYRGLSSASIRPFHAFPEIRGCHCRAAILLLHHLLSWVDDQTSLYRETLAFGKKSSFPGQQMPLIGTERVGNPAFAVVLPPQLCCRRGKRLRWKL